MCNCKYIYFNVQYVKGYKTLCKSNYNHFIYYNAQWSVKKFDLKIFGMVVEKLFIKIYYKTIILIISSIFNVVLEMCFVPN